MNFYEVQISITTVVQASSFGRAWEVACQNKHEIMDDLGVGDVTVMQEIASAADLPQGWRLDFYPYGQVHGEKEVTCGEIIAALPEPVEEYNPWTDDQIYENL